MSPQKPASRPKKARPHEKVALARPRAKPTRSRATRSERLVYSFGGGKADGDRTMKDLLGGKGANLAEMSRLGLPVPPGFTLSTEVCTHFYSHGRRYPSSLEHEVQAALEKVERELGKRFGDAADPLLVSVRSGARVSMPGMMDTVLNLGLNDTTVEGLARVSSNPRFAWDAYRRFVQMYADVVLGLKGDHGDERNPFAAALDRKKHERGVALDTELTAADLKELVTEFKWIVQQRTGRRFPEDPREQLWGAIGAVFGSWENDRARAYREMQGIPHDWGTAVSVVAMVYGNLGPDSGTGVAFTRDPATGERKFYGEYLMNAQGEDVVAGIRTPLPIGTLEKGSPRAWKELQRIQLRLEKHFREMQDIEFTVEEGKLYLLQTRTGKRTARAALRIAVDMAGEGLISREEAVARIDPGQLDQLLHPMIDPEAEVEVIAEGLNASPGAATGLVVFDADTAEERGRAGEDVLLVRWETTPDDIHGL
ncbi:MAG: pyruvate, phosphate dikinase, partial [Planctomycetaceae bacterium]|nr:pyruvate, phosphate dikinase [Planctomycetaceae bacterium]